MPNYRIIEEGGLISGGKRLACGTTLEMSEKDAKSLPPGTVELDVEAVAAPIAPTPAEPPALAPKPTSQTPKKGGTK